MHGPTLGLDRTSPLPAEGGGALDVGFGIEAVDTEGLPVYGLQVTFIPDDDGYQNSSRWSHTDTYQENYGPPVVEGNKVIATYPLADLPELHRVDRWWAFSGINDGGVGDAKLQFSWEDDDQLMYTVLIEDQCPNNATYPEAGEMLGWPRP